MTLEIYTLIWISLLGLCLGSFYNVVILRSLSDESIVLPPSKCPKCNNRLKWWHNIPVISYILLRGKCYYCHQKISIQYPIIEILTMLIFGFTFIYFGFSINTIFVLFWLSCLLIMTVTDIKEQLVDCRLAIIMGIGGFLFNAINGLWLNSIAGALIGIIILEVIARSGYIFIKDRAMGEADTYVAAGLGAIFGLNILNVLIGTLLISMIFILPTFIYNLLKIKSYGVLSSFILFITSIVIFYTQDKNYLTISLVIISGIVLCGLIIKNIKLKNNLHYLPFVPALSIAAAILMFLYF